MKISLIPPDHIDAVWLKAGPLLKKATDLSGDRYKVSDVYRQLRKGDKNLWIAFEGDAVLGAVTSEVVDYPGRRMLILHFCGGEDMASWFTPMLDTLERWARDNNCNGIEVFGRDGWKRWLGRSGFGDGFRLYTKDLDNGQGQ